MHQSDRKSNVRQTCNNLVRDSSIPISNSEFFWKTVLEITFNHALNRCSHAIAEGIVLPVDFCRNVFFFFFFFSLLLPTKPRPCFLHSVFLTYLAQRLHLSYVGRGSFTPIDKTDSKYYHHGTDHLHERIRNGLKSNINKPPPRTNCTTPSIRKFSTNNDWTLYREKYICETKIREV